MLKNRWFLKAYFYIYSLSENREVYTNREVYQASIIEITKLFYTNKGFVIFDKTVESIVIFNDKGKFIKRINTDKDLPKIFNVSFDYLNNQILVHNEKSYSISYFNLSGEFIKKTSTPFFYNHFHQLVSTNEFVFLSVDSYNDKLHYNFKNSEFFFGQLDKITSYLPNYATPKLLNEKFAPKDPITSSSNSVFYTPKFSNEIFRIKSDSIKLIFKIDFPGKTIANAIKGKTFEEYIDVSNDHKYYSLEGYVYEVGNFISFQTRKNERVGYFYNTETAELIGGHVRSELKFGEEALLPQFSYPIAANGDYFISVLYPPYHTFKELSSESQKIFNKNKESLILCLYNVQ